MLNQLFARKSLETLDAEAKGENRLRRVLGPIALTSLGIGAIIGSGIFVMTGRVAAVDAGPAVVLSYVVAGLGCALAALCYAEFASTVPVAGSAYTYAYATLGELFAWIIGWDLVLEYAMACAVVASGWAHYLNEFLKNFGTSLPMQISSDPFTQPGAWFNLPSVLIVVAVAVVLVIGIRESATTNALLVMLKVGVVLFVIFAGLAYVNTRNWTGIPVTERLTPEQLVIEALAKKQVKEATLPREEVERRVNAIGERVRQLYQDSPKLSAGEANARVERIKNQVLGLYEETARLPEPAAEERVKKLTAEMTAVFQTERLDGLRREGNLPEEEARAVEEARARYAKDLPQTEEERALVDRLLVEVREEAPKQATAKWGMFGLLGLNRALARIDDNVRSPYIPYGLSGIMLAASLVFFAYIGFDSISTHSEEARKPQRDVPIGILASLGICTVLYIAVSAVITGMEPYPQIDRTAAVAAAFRHQAEMPGQQNSLMLRASAFLIGAGALAGLTSVLLITFLSQARIFLAMARDGLLPPRIFGAVHHRFRTPHLSTMLTGAVICVVGAFTPIADLEEMVNIGTLMAFVIVCAAVLILRIKRPDAHRPFRCPAVYLLAPLGILVNFIMMMFLPPITWLRLVGWLVLGLCIYFFYGMAHSTLGRQMRGLPALAGTAQEHAGPAMEPPIALKREEGIQP
jgi:amino acid transporter